MTSKEHPLFLKTPISKKKLNLLVYAYKLKNRTGGKMKKLSYYFHCAKWLWKNRNWTNNRQKYKAMAKEMKKYE